MSGWRRQHRRQAERLITKGQAAYLRRWFAMPAPGERQHQAGFLFVKPESAYGITPMTPLGESHLATIGDYIHRALGNRHRMRTYPDGCTCPKLPADGTPQTYDLQCPIQGHRRLAVAARHRKC